MPDLASQIRQYASSPAAFRDGLLIDADAGPVPFGGIMDPWQRADFAALDGALMHVAGSGPAPVHQRAYLERPRGHSKTMDLASVVLWLLAFSPRHLSGVAAAADKTQAKLLRDSIDRLLRLNPWLASQVDVQRDCVVCRRTGSRLETLSSDAPASYGRTPDFVCIDELTHWQSEDLWTSLLSAAGKRGHCLLVVIANAGFAESWQRRVYDAVRDDPGWYFNSLDGPQASWITADRLEEQRRLLPEPAYRRLWLNEWSSGSGDALSGADVLAAVTADGPMHGDERGFKFVGGLDLGVSRDRSALAVVGRNLGWSEHRDAEPPPVSTVMSALMDLGLCSPPAVAPDEPDVTRHEGSYRYRLAHVQSWKPTKHQKVNLEAVENAVLDAQVKYGLAGVYFDPSQALHMAQRLHRRGVHMVPCHPTASVLSKMTTTLLESFSSRVVDLYSTGEAELLLTQLQQLRIIERQASSYRLASPRDTTGHGDLATAFVLALCGASRLRHAPALTRPLLFEQVRFDDLYPPDLYRSDDTDPQWEFQ